MRWGCNGVRKVDDPSIVFSPSPSPFNSPDLYRVSGKFEVLDRMLPKFKASGHRWVGLIAEGVCHLYFCLSVRNDMAASS